MAQGAPVTVVNGTDGSSGPVPVSLPDNLISGGGIDGTNPRFRVDVGEPSFFDGRQFRLFKELNLTLGSIYVIKAVTTKNIILYGLDLSLTSGEVKLETVAGGTEGGSFSETFTLFPRNTMSERPTPIYTPTSVVTAGGTHTGGTVLDLIWVKTADNSNFAASIGVAPGDERGVAAGTYYFRLNAVIAATGVFKARFEERL